MTCAVHAQTTRGHYRTTKNYINRSEDGCENERQRCLKYCLVSMKPALRTLSLYKLLLLTGLKRRTLEFWFDVKKYLYGLERDTNLTVMPEQSILFLDRARNIKLIRYFPRYQGFNVKVQSLLKIHIWSAKKIARPTPVKWTVQKTLPVLAAWTRTPVCEFFHKLYFI